MQLKVERGPKEISFGVIFVIKGGQQVQGLYGLPDCWVLLASQKA
jgi:hypothetical protein